VRLPEEGLDLMARIAGDAPGYSFRLCRMTNGFATPTSHGFDLISVSTFIGDVMGKPAGAMSYWGFRIGMSGVVDALAEGEALDGLDAETLEELLKQRGVSPNMRLAEAGDRGNNAHQILEWIAAGWDEEGPEANAEEPSFRMVAEAYAEDEERTAGTRYGWGVIEWWDQQVQPQIDCGYIDEVHAEVPVWSLKHRFAGQFDLAIHWSDRAAEGGQEPGYEVLDLKTHKPASGFTKPGQGPGYVSEAAQIRAYRMAWEEMGLGKTIGQRIVLARDRAYRGQTWVEDFREVSEDFVLALRQAFDYKQQFEAGEEA